MAQPRFLFVAGDAGRPSWTFWMDEPAERAEPGADRAWVAWRLAAANNRELGRSAFTFADVASSQKAAARLQQEVDHAEPIILSEANGLWHWRIDLDGRPAAAAARLYLRQRECQYSLTQFLAAVPIAAITSHVVALSRDIDRGDRGDRGGRPAGPERPGAGPGLRAVAAPRAGATAGGGPRRPFPYGSALGWVEHPVSRLEWTNLTRTSVHLPFGSSMSGVHFRVPSGQPDGTSVFAADE